MAKTIYSIFCPGVLLSGKQPQQVYLSAVLAGQFPWLPADGAQVMRWERRAGGEGAARTPESYRAPLLQACSSLVGGGGGIHTATSFFPPLPVHVRDSPCFWGQEGLPQGGRGRGVWGGLMPHPATLSCQPQAISSTFWQLALKESCFRGLQGTGPISGMLPSWTARPPHPGLSPDTPFCEPRFFPPGGAGGLGLWAP